VLLVGVWRDPPEEWVAGNFRLGRWGGKGARGADGRLEAILRRDS